MKLKDNRTGPKGLANLLLADSIVEDGILLQQDGSLLAAWEYEGPDLASAEPEHLNSLAERVASALRLGTGWMVHCDAIRNAVPGYPDPVPFPDPVSALIDDERREQFRSGEALFQSRYFLAITYLPAIAREEKSVAWLVDGSHEHLDVAAAHIRKFKLVVAQFESTFLSVVNARRLKSVETADEFGWPVVHDELLHYIHLAITGKDHPVLLPKIPVGLADLLASEDFVGGLRPKIGDKHIRVVAIHGFPEMSRPGILAVLDQLPIEYRWSTRAILMDPIDARTFLAKVRTRWRGLSRGFFAQITGKKSEPQDRDLHAIDMMEDAHQAEAAAVAHRVEFCHHTCCVVLMHERPEAVAESVRTLITAVQNLGFAARSENVNAVEAWLGTHPGNGYANVRRIVLHTDNLADMLPLTSVWAGLEVNPSALMPKNSPPLCHAVTTGDTPFRLNLHVADLGGSLFIGPSGAGKSTALGLLAAQWFRYPGAQVFAFDWDYSMWLLTEALGGRHYDLMGTQGIAFCPLSHLETADDLAWATGWLEDLCRLNGVQLEPHHSNAIVEAVKGLAVSKHRTLTDFMHKVQDEQIKAALRYYTLEGSLGELLDAEHDSFSVSHDTRMVAIETKGLMVSPDPRASLPVLMYLFRRIEQRLDGSPTLIPLDEAWAYLGHPIFRDRLAMWLKTLRRRNAALVLASQQISDIANSSIADTVFAQTPTKILLPNADAVNPDSMAFYQRLGLNSREIGIIQQATPKRDYYVTCPSGRRLINLCIGDVAMSFCGVNSPPQRKKAAQMMKDFPHTWQAEWLRSRGAADWADMLESELAKGHKQCAIA